MKHLQLYEDYTDKELEDLLGDLSDVGQVGKVKVSCFTEVSCPHQAANPSWWTTYDESFAIVFCADRGSESANKDFALQKIKEGKFDQFLESTKDPFRRQVDPEVLRIIDRKNIQKIASQVQSLDELLRVVRGELIETLAKFWEKSIEPIVSLMGDRELEDFHRVEWKSTPTKLRETIGKNLDFGIRIKKIE